MSIEEPPGTAGPADGVDEEALAAIGHPRGTLAVLGAYFALFVAGWVLLYYFLFLPRGAPQL